MLKNYTGAANSPDILKHLIGETIRGAFVADDGNIYIVMESGDALALHEPTYWKESAKAVAVVVGKRKAKIEEQLAELGRLTAIEMSCPTDG